MNSSTETRPVLLNAIAYARSGDKGCNANIGLIAYTPEGYDVLRELMTEQRVLQYFSNTPCHRVERFELPNLGALNFMLYGVLGKGGSQSLAVDAQGKTLGQVLLAIELELTEEQHRAATP